MVAKIVKENVAALKKSEQTFESIYTILKESFTSEVFAEWLEDGIVKEMSYYEMFERTDLFSKAVIDYAKKCGSDSRFVGVFLDNSADWVAIFWGILQAGYKPILLNTRHNVAVNGEIIAEMDPVFVISNDARIDRAISVKDLLQYGKDIKSVKEITDWEDEIVLISSGSTARPKIISHKGRTICALVEMSEYIVSTNTSIQFNRKLEIHNLAFLPFYHIFGLVATLMWFMFFGRTFTFLPKYDAQSIQFICKRMGVTHFFAIPLVFNKVVAGLEREVALQGQTEKFNKAINFSNKLQSIFPRFGAFVARKILFKKVRRQVLGEKLMFLISGGGFIAARTLEVMNGLGYSVYPGYGLTECGILSVELTRNVKYRNGTSTGIIFDNVKYIQSEKGELLIPKDKAMNGLYIDGKLVEYAEDYYPTNDIVEIDETGRLHIIGRCDDVIIGSNGENISPEEIECRIYKGAFTNAALIYAKLSGMDEKQMVLVLSDDGKMGAYEKASSLKSVYASIDQLTLSERPAKVLNIVGECPMTFKGINRKALASKLENNEIFATECQRPSDDEVMRTRSAEYTELLEKICDIFAQVLIKDRSEITDTSNFIALGGDSMQYVELLSKVAEVTGKQITMTETPLITPMAIADYIIEQSKEPKS